MELVRGIRITDYCDQANLRTQDRLELFIKVCQAIQHAHQKGIIHRDIKPSNILVTLHDGVPVPKVIDFGIAKATEGRLTDNTVYTQLHQFIGTPAYMSPEQAEMSGLDIDTRSDIYSLGVLLYELLTGSTPFDPKELMSGGIDAMRKTIREKEPQRPSTRLATLGADQLTTTAKRRSADTSKLLHQLKGDLDWIVMKCLEKDRARRYDTANGLAADVTRHLTNEPVVARPPSQLYRLQKMVRRNKTASLATASIMIALSIGVGLAMAALMQKNAAKQRELDQSVRADTVATFVNSLISDTLPAMIRQGNTQGARELINTADRLATSSLSNTPAAEVELRWRLFKILFRDINDPQAFRRQAELISGLLSKVAADQIKVSREQLRIAVSTAQLWAADPRGPAMEKPMQELDALHVEFMGRTPPAKGWAAFCRYHQGQYLMVFRKLELAEEKLAAAYELLPKDMREPAPERWDIPACYMWVLADLRKLSRAEEVARWNPKLPPRADTEARAAFLNLVSERNNILCLQDRFSEALRLMEEEKRVLADSGASESNLLRLDAMRGEVLARSGNTGEAMKVLMQVAANPLSNADYLYNAAVLAVATGDHGNHLLLLNKFLGEANNAIYGAYWDAFPAVQASRSFRRGLARYGLRRRHGPAPTPSRVARRACATLNCAFRPHKP